MIQIFCQCTDIINKVLLIGIVRFYLGFIFSIDLYLAFIFNLMIIDSPIDLNIISDRLKKFHNEELKEKYSEKDVYEYYNKNTFIFKILTYFNQQI